MTDKLVPVLARATEGTMNLSIIYGYLKLVKNMTEYEKNISYFH